jgi:hypothetical protein
MFKQFFNQYVCEGDTISTDVEGFTVIAHTKHDTDYHIDDDDCHNTDQSVTGCDDAQFERLLAARKAWFKGEWFYCGVVLSVHKNGVCLVEHAASLWGVEANYPGASNNYLTQVADDLLPEAIEQGKAILIKLCA